MFCQLRIKKHQTYLEEYETSTCTLIPKQFCLKKIVSGKHYLISIYVGIFHLLGYFAAGLVFF